MYEDFIAAYDAAAGAKAVGIDNLKDLLKKEKEADEQGSQGRQGQAAGKGEKPRRQGRRRQGRRAESSRAGEDAEGARGAGEGGRRLGGRRPVQRRPLVGRAGQVRQGHRRLQRATSRASRTRRTCPKIAYNIGLIYEKDKKWAEALKAFDAFLATYAKDNRVTDVAAPTRRSTASSSPTSS